MGTVAEVVHRGADGSVHYLESSVLGSTLLITDPKAGRFLFRFDGRAGVRLEPRFSVGATTRMPASEHESVNLGRVSSAALMLSGVAGVVTPERVASALQLTPASSRGIAEVRAGLG